MREEYQKSDCFYFANVIESRNRAVSSKKFRIPKFHEKNHSLIEKVRYYGGGGGGGGGGGTSHPSSFAIGMTFTIY